jgi:hypothetical protein
MRKILMLLALIMITSSVGFSQTVQLKGTVKGASDGQPIAGVTISVKGTTVGTQTDASGNY